MDNVRAPASFKCQTCCHSFETQKKLEIHIDSYQRLASNLFFQITYAAAHLAPVIEDKPEADQFSLAGFDGVCPHPKCGQKIPSIQLIKSHFSHHIGCHEICPGCSAIYNNANAFLMHTKSCILTCGDAAKLEHGLKRGRALLQRTMVRFKHAMDSYRPGILDRGRNTNEKSHSRPPSSSITPVLKQEDPGHSWTQSQVSQPQPQVYGTAQGPGQVLNGTPPYEARQFMPGAEMHVPHGSAFTTNTHVPEAAKSNYPSPDSTNGSQASPDIPSQSQNLYETMPGIDECIESSCHA